jgi:hypothetical protein
MEDVNVERVRLMPGNTWRVCVCLKANEQILHHVPFIRLGLLRGDNSQTWVALLGRCWQGNKTPTLTAEDSLDWALLLIKMRPCFLSSQ